MVVPRRRGIILGGALLLVVTILLLVTQGDQQDKDKAGGRKGPQRSKKHPNQEEYLDRRGIRVIVGHYKGDEGPGPNLTQQELDANNFKPEVIILQVLSLFISLLQLCYFSGWGWRGRTTSQPASSSNNPGKEALPHQPVQHLGLGQDKS